MVYLAFVALLPFPTGVLDEFGENPIAVVAFALPWLAIAMWLLAIPLQRVWARHRPAAAGRYLT